MLLYPLNDYGIKVNDFSVEDMLSIFKEENLSVEKIQQLKHLTDSDLGKMKQLIKLKQIMIF